ASDFAMPRFAGSAGTSAVGGSWCVAAASCGCVSLSGARRCRGGSGGGGRGRPAGSGGVCGWKGLGGAWGAAGGGGGDRFRGPGGGPGSGVCGIMVMVAQTVRVFPSDDRELGGDVVACVTALGEGASAEALEERLRPRWPTVRVVAQAALAHYGLATL